MGTYAVAVDVGGTFTDIVLCDLESNAQRVFKTPSTPDDPAVGFMTGLARILADNGVEPSEVVHIFHGTTIATNSVLENKGAPVGLLVTEGFKYVLEIARHGMPRLANPHSWVKPDRPVRPRDCLEVRERTGYDGAPLLPMDEEAVRDAADHFDQAGISSVAVSFLHSYANPENERRAREILGEALPGAAVSLSSEVLPVYQEYERTITTVLNAYVTPRVSVYIENLKNSLRDFGAGAAFSIMKSNGGTIGADMAAKQPVYTALSGPAAGVMATAQIAETTGIENCISFDMGGTSTDVSLLRNREPGMTLNGKLGDWPVQLPMLDIATIGCGGGSIAKVSPYGSLTVGPASAGADPRPRLLRQRIDPANGHRREPGTGAGGYADCRRAACPRPGRGSESHRRQDCVAAGVGRSGGGQRHPENRQQRDGGGHTQHQRGAGPRSQGLRAGSLRRRRADARHRRGGPAGDWDGGGAAASRNRLGLRSAGGRVQERLRADVPATPPRLRPGWASRSLH